MKKLLLLALLSLSLVVTGCINMPTRSAQITGAYVSEYEYEGMKCDRLAAELNSLTRREAQLVAAQEQRYSSSKVQAFWIGFGRGDGIEAAELAQVRGQIEAIMRMRDVKKCKS